MGRSRRVGRMNGEKTRRFKAMLICYYGAECFYCGHEVIFGARDGHRYAATLDHVLVASEGGLNHLGNLVLACFRCNNVRSNMSFEDFMTVTLDKMNAAKREKLYERYDRFEALRTAHEHGRDAEYALLDSVMPYEERMETVEKFMSITCAYALAAA